MNENFENLRLSPAPHAHTRKNTASLMTDVIIALLPVQAFAVWMFGARVLLLLFVCIASSVFSEWVFRKACKLENSVHDRSAVVTGIILACTLPAGLPLWMAAAGSVFAIIIVKQLFGGLGGNFVNPAAAAFVFLSVSFSEKMNTWPINGKMCAVIADTGVAGAVSGPTPLLLLKNDMGDLPSTADLLFGRVSGGLGEICVIAILIGGLWLLLRRAVSPIVPVCFLGSVAVICLIYARDPIYDLLAGGTMFAAFFMAPEPVTSPVTRLGNAVYGIGCGIITMLIRIYSVFPDGAIQAVLFMNLLVPAIDRLTRIRLPKAARKGGSVNEG